MKTKTQAKKVARKVARKSVMKTEGKVFVKNSFASKNTLLESLKNEDNKTFTENGALTYKSTLNSVLDLFAMGGALRTRGEGEIIKLFVKANAEDQLLAMKCLFHIRNIRGGSGERKTFRIILKWLANNYPDVVRKNLGNIVHYGRFDDLYELFDTKCESNAMSFMAAQLDNDFKAMEKGERVSLAAKWTKSLNTSSASSRELAEKLRAFLKCSPKAYRQALSALREYSNVLEVKLSKNEWTDIDYSKLSSKAGLVYRNAFRKHDPTGYQNFLDSVKKGTAKVNAGTLFPYEIVDKVLAKNDNSETLDIMWDALPNYLEGNDRNILVIADTSGSMMGLPISVSVSLALYTAERNSGAFKNHFLTFSTIPTLQSIKGNNVREKILNLNRAKWDMSTDLQAAFRLVLQHAVASKTPTEQMPEQIIIVSDMEFNSAIRGSTNLDAIRGQYRAAGYEMPNLVFWNVNSRNNNVAAKADDKGVVLVSGCSPSVFKTLLSGKSYTPLDQMLETLNNPMYDLVTV